MKIIPNPSLPKQQLKPFKIPKENNPYYVITGGPGVGKTSLLQELHKRGFPILPDITREFITGQQDIDGEALPWRNKILYRDEMFECARDSFETTVNHYKGNGPIFFDGSFMDVICYTALKGLPLNQEMKTYAETHRYRTEVFILPPWKDLPFTHDQENQDWNEVVFIYNKMIQTYRSYLYDPIEVPKIAVSERADFIIDHIKKN